MEHQCIFALLSKRKTQVSFQMFSKAKRVIKYEYKFLINISTFELPFVYTKWCGFNFKKLKLVLSYHLERMQHIAFTTDWYFLLNYSNENFRDTHVYFSTITQATVVSI